MQFEPIIAHRGASGYAPENTMIAFKKALALGCRTMEFDVMLSADGEPFVFHDDHLKRTTNGRGALGLVNADYVRTLDAGRWFARRFQGQHVPHLREVLQWLIEENVQANIEIKPFPGQTEPTVISVLTHIHQYWPKDRALPLVSSFDLDALRMCRSIAPELPLGLLLDEWQDTWLQLARELFCFSIHINRRALTKERVTKIKQEGYKLFAYTVNRKRQARKLMAWGVDALFSDYPDLLS